MIGGRAANVATRRHQLLLILLVLIWAISWPVIKVGVSTVPPLWFACWRYVIATCCLFAFAAVRRELTFPPRSDWRLVGVSGVLQMGTYSALTALALTILQPGRASVLAFSTPLWVVPLAAVWLHERTSWRTLLGVGAGLLGVLVIATPAFQHQGSGQVLPYAMLMGAAAAWAISIVFVRAHRFIATPLMLAPWQTLVAAALLCPLAVAVEGRPVAIAPSGMLSLAYVGPIATAFAYWALVELGRRFRASTISMALLATPSIGLLISALTLGETVSVSLVIGVILVGGGIRLATMPPKAATNSARHCPNPSASTTRDRGDSAGSETAIQHLVNLDDSSKGRRIQEITKADTQSLGFRTETIRIASAKAANEVRSTLDLSGSVTMPVSSIFLPSKGTVAEASSISRADMTVIVSRRDA